MAIAQGFGKTSTNGLIFGYDTGDMDNSFKGAPKTNLLSVYSRTYGNQSSSVFKTQYYTREVFVPTLGTRSVETMETYNDYGGGSGVCCQGAWYFGGAGVAGSTQYTYSIIYRSNSGYTHPNFMYRYEYGASGYITEGGLHNDGNRTHLGDGWYHAWGNMTTQPGTTSMGFYFYMYEYGTYNTIDIAAVMFTQGPEIIRPRQFIPFSTTRSVTQGLLDLTGNGTIDLSNISFDSIGQIIFDGTNDYIDLGYAPFSGTGPFSVETVYTLNTTETHTIVGNYPASSFQFMGRFGLYINGSCYFPSPLGPGTYYAAATRDSSGICRLYLNSVLATTVSNGNNIGTNSFRMGTNTVGTEVLNGKVPVLKLYNRALTATEITQNYSHYKTRFNL
jgi:hypothetical protein